MPNRILKERVTISSDIESLTWQEEVCWYRLLTQCDDYGRYYADPAVIRGRCFPKRLKRVTEAMVGKWLARFAELRMVQLYEIDGECYLQALNFEKHQGVPRAKTSKFPQPPADAGTCEQTQADVAVFGIRIRGSDSSPISESDSSTAAVAANGAKPVAKPTSTQAYLLGELQGGGSGAWESFTFGAIVEANKDFGREVVTTVLGHAKIRLVEEGWEPEQAYPWFRKACEEQAKVTA